MKEPGKLAIVIDKISVITQKIIEFWKKHNEKNIIKSLDAWVGKVDWNIGCLIQN